MNFTVSKDNFSNLLYLASTIVERRNTMPILANVNIQAKGKSVSVSATDLEISLLGSAPAKVDKPGSLTVGAKVFYDIVRELPEQDISIKEGASGRLEIKSGNSLFKINGTSSDEFPSLVGCSLKDAVSVEASKLYEMFDKTSFAVSTDETRYNINGVNIEMVDGQGEKSSKKSKSNTIRFVSTDGHRLAMIDRPAEGIKVDSSVIVPRKGISELKKVLESNDGSAKISFNEGFFTVQSGSVTVGVRLVDGQFPDYNQVIPKEVKTTINVSKNDFLASIKRVSLVTADKSRTVRFGISGNTMTLTSSSPEYGEAKEVVEVQKDGDDIEIGFSARYVIDLLGAMSSSENVTINLNGELGPGMFMGDDEKYKAIVMPMRFDKD